MQAALLLLCLGAPHWAAPRAALGGGKGFAGGFDTIVEADLARDLHALADPELEGRDTPSVGLERAARIIEERFTAAGLAGVADVSGVSGAASDGSFRRAFEHAISEPEPEGCSLESQAPGAGSFRLGRDFVPLHGFAGEVDGEIVFAGYGIRSKTERYDDLAGLKLDKKIALVLGGEPRHERKFDGPEISRAASLWDKIDALAEAGASAVLAVRRPAAEPPRPQGKRVGKGPATGGAPGDAAGDAAADGRTAAEDESEISYRYTWADFNGVASDPPARSRLPVLEISLSCASALLGQDVEDLADRIDRSVHPVKAPSPGRGVRLRSRTKESRVQVDNLLGLLRGSDAILAEEVVVVGAHYDHVGVDARGRIACGADDNASGVAGMLEIAEALAEAGPRRSVLFCAFAGEEDGLLGSQALCGNLPVPKERIVAMINMDMIGRGEESEVAVIGIVQNPGFEKVIARAKKLKPSGVRQVVLREGEELFERSDHYSFHRIGVPVLFFFEGLPIERNKDYHTWRDTVDKVDTRKMLNTTRFVYNVTWLLTDDEERPPPPRD